MNTTTANPSTTGTTFAIATAPNGRFQIEVITSAGTSLVRDRYNDVRTFATRSSARKAITRLRRSL